MAQLELGMYGSRDLMNLQIYTAGTMEPLMYFKLANTVEEGLDSDLTWASGGGSRQLAWSNEITGTLTVTSQLFSLQQTALMYGQSIVEAASDIYKSEVLEVKAGGIVTLSKTPINNDIAVFPFVNGMLKRLPQKVLTVSGTGVTLDLSKDTSVEEGDEVEVYYQFNAGRAFTLNLTSKSNSPYVTIVGDTLWADKNSGMLVPVQKIYHRAKLQQSATVGFSATGDPTDFTMTFELLSKTIKGEEVISSTIVYEDPTDQAQYIDVKYGADETVHGDVTVTPPTTTP